MEQALKAWEKRFGRPGQTRQVSLSTPAKPRRGLLSWFYSALRNQAVRAAEDTPLLTKALTCLERAVELGHDRATIKRDSLFGFLALDHRMDGVLHKQLAPQRSLASKRLLDPVQIDVP